MHAVCDPTNLAGAAVMRLRINCNSWSWRERFCQLPLILYPQMQVDGQLSVLLQHFHLALHSQNPETLFFGLQCRLRQLWLLRGTV